MFGDVSRCSPSTKEDADFIFRSLLSLAGVTAGRSDHCRQLILFKRGIFAELNRLNYVVNYSSKMMSCIVETGLFVVGIW